MKTKRKPEATDAEKWLEKIRRAVDVREEWRKLFRVDLAYAYWEGRQRPENVSEREWITINLIFSSLLAELPSLYSTDPYYYVKLAKSYSVNPMDIALFEAKAKTRQSMINYLKAELKLKAKARLSIFDAFFQFGLCKIHFAADLMENPDAGREIRGEGDMFLLGDGGTPLLEPDLLPANESYKITRVHPNDFVVDEDAGPLDDDVSWKAQRIRRPIEDVQKDKRYESKGRNAVKATETKSDTEKEREQRKKGGLATEGKGEEQPDTVVLWEVYDLKKKQWLVVAEECSEFLVKPSRLPGGIEGDPFVDLRFHLRDDSWYPLPPVSQWLDSQREYNEIRSKMLVHRKRFNRKYTCYTPAFDDGESAMSQLENGDDGTVIAQNQPMQTVYPIADAPLDSNHHMEVGYIRQDFMALAVGPNQTGSTAGVDSATEAGILEKRTQIREGDKQGVVGDFLTDIGRKLDQIVQANITQDQAVKIAGPGSVESWELIRAADYDEIAGEYQYSIATGSTTPQLPEIERAQFLGFLTWLSNAITVAPDMISSGLIKKIAELHHISPDDPLVQEIVSAAAKRVQAGMIPQPGGGGQGSQPGIPDNNPISGILGAATGMNNIGSLRGGPQ